MTATAARVRAAKLAHPEQFCAHTGCLWRIVTHRGPNPCQRHKARTLLPTSPMYDSVEVVSTPEQFKASLPQAARTFLVAKVEPTTCFVCGKVEDSSQAVLTGRCKHCIHADPDVVRAAMARRPAGLTARLEALVNVMRAQQPEEKGNEYEPTEDVLERGDLCPDCHTVVDGQHLCDCAHPF